MKRSRDSATVAAFIVVVGAMTATYAHAHHILGVPHYSYDEDYPQTPVLTYRVDTGRYDVKMTGYPGKPEPGQRCSLHLYIRHNETGSLLDARVKMTVTRQRFLLSDPVIYGPMQAELDERIYKFHPHFDLEGEYLVSVEFEAEGEPWRVDVPLVVGEPRSPVVVLGVSLSGLVLFVLIARALRIKRARRARAPGFDTHSVPSP